MDNYDAIFNFEPLLYNINTCKENFEKTYVLYKQMCKLSIICLIFVSVYVYKIKFKVKKKCSKFHKS